MATFNHTFTVEASLEQVAAFHSDTQVLKRLTPLPVIVQLHRFEPLGEGAVAEFTLWLGPLPIRWVALHQDFHPLFGFKDIQQQGPFKRWVHCHTFIAEAEDRTLVCDSISYEHYPGWKGLFTRLLFPSPVFYFLFAYRQWVTRRGVRRGSQGIG
jgi:ligand-binding SRPBCC domain-containing protein